MTKGLAVSNVVHRFGDKVVLRDATMTAKPGELVCLLGPSGCGKTTLLRIAAGLEPLQEGRVEIGGRVVADSGHSLPPEKRNVGLMFQDYALFPHLSVLDNVLFGLQGWHRAEADKRARTLLERMGMAHHADSFPHVLSGGQQQRVALARALAPDPEVLLLDEPFSGLDVTLRAQVREEILEILKETGVAAVMVTHDPEEAMFMADRIKVLGAEGEAGGRIIQAGTPEEIYFHPADPFVARFFGPVNRLIGVVENGCAKTALGCIPAPGIQDDEAVVVLLRHEALRLGIGYDGGLPVTITASRLLGGTNHVHFRLNVEGDDGTEFESLMPVGFPAVYEGPMSVTIDARLAFVFPKNGD